MILVVDNIEVELRDGTVANGIRYSCIFDFDQGPPVQIYRKVHIGGDPSANLTEVYFPVRQRSREAPGQSKNRQETGGPSG